MKPKALTKSQIQNTLTNAVRQAVDFIESEIAPDRIKAQKYFSGGVNLQNEDGRSKVVATKCRDTIRAVKPSLMRVFLQSGRPVEFIPSNPATQDAAEQATNYARWTFERNNGFQILSDVVHDALVKKVGIAKVWYEETPEVEIDEYTGVTDDMLAYIAAQDDVEIIEQETEIDTQIGPDGVSVSTSMHNLKVARTSKRGHIKIKAIAPEDFFVDRTATGIDDCYVCGHSSPGRVGDLVAMGFDFDEVSSLSGDAEGASQDEEQLVRSGYDSDLDDTGGDDPSMRPVLVTEAYMRMDIEGTGVPRLYKFICGGSDYTILERELCDYVPFAVFEVDPQPHTFFGWSLVDIITDDQDASTSLLRGLLDSIQMSNNPRVIANDTLVNMDDLLNNEIGGVVRVKDMNAIRELVVGTAATTAMPAIAYYDELIRGKTGVSGSGMGMDPDALQSQTAAGVNAAVQAASAVAELIARTLAEGGMKQMFRLIAQIARANPNPDEMMRIDGQFIPVDPSSWTADMDLIANVGLGTNQHMERLVALDATIQTQMGIWQAYGPQNGLVTMTGIRNALADKLALSGIHNANRYYQPMNPQTEQQLLAMQAQAAQQAQQGQGAGDPNAAYLQAEQMKTSARVQADMAKAQLDARKAAMNDDLERDRMAQDLALSAAEIAAKYGIAIDTARIRAQQAATPGPMQAPQMGMAGVPR